MADTTTTSTNQPALVNGIDRLTTINPPPTDPTPATPPAQQPSSTEQAQPDTGQDTPYRNDPHLLPEHALLGSLLHAPNALDDLEEFLGVRDFSTPQTRAVYASLRGLHRAGSLFDVAAMPTEAQKLYAANENHVRLFSALRGSPPPFTTITIGNIPQLIAQLNAAAPPESLPIRGIYDPRNIRSSPCVSPTTR